MIRKNILSLNLSSLKYNEALEEIISLARRRQPSYICFANVHMVIEAYDNPIFAQKGNSANLVLPDGMPLVASLRKIYNIPQERIAGMDVFPDLLKLCTQNNLSIYLFGSTQEVLNSILNRIKIELPGLKIAGACSPPFDKPINDEKYVRDIRLSGADMVFVALGCPKQEKWIAENSINIEGVLLGIGAAFPIYAKVQKMAPAFIRNNSLEWTYRLLQEPKRLLFRYSYTNTKFLILLFRQFFNMKING